MIYVLSDSILNRKCAALLSSELPAEEIMTYPFLLFDKSQASSDNLFIVDLTSDIPLASRSTPEIFADYLIDMGLPKNISNIYLVIPDENIEKSMIAFAENLSRAFSEFHQRNVAVHVPAQLGYDATVVVPSEKNNEWEIYGFKDNDDSRELIWKGSNIAHYMNNAQHTYDGISYVWP